MLEENAFNIVKQNKEKYNNIINSDTNNISDVNNYDITSENFLLNSLDIDSISYNSEMFDIRGGANIEEDNISDLDINEMTENINKEIEKQ